MWGRQRGQYALITAIGLVPALASGALAVDLALASAVSSEAELVAYSAAQTAVVAHSQGRSVAEAYAIADTLVRAHATLDGPRFTLTELQWGTVNRASGRLVTTSEVEAVRATVRRTGTSGVRTLFGSFFGLDTLDMGASAISDTLPSDFDADDCDTRVTFAGASGYIGRDDFTRVISVHLDETGHGGWYRVYKDQVAESGASQRNESSYYRVINDTNPLGLPLDPNCDGDYIVEDYDNEGLNDDRVYLGTFWFDADADNELQMRHYCGIRDLCPSFEDWEDSCGDSFDSIHLDRGDANLCLEAQ